MENIIGQTILNRYRVEGRIGLGGMSEVYRAFDQQRQITVALKFLREDFAEDPEFERRFRKEASALQRLTHPGIVRYYELERDGAQLFMVMDFIDGIALRRHLFLNGPILAPGEALGILTPIAGALNYAHAQGVIHRDIKPGNIMLAKDGNALLTDFGIAKFTDSATITTVMAGTPAYMSPEQCAERPLDARSDVYSLGLLAYEMLAGRRPFVGETAGIQGVTTAERIRAEHLSVLPPPASSLNPQLPTQLDDLLARALAKRPQERYADTLEFIQALRHALPGVVDIRSAVQIPTITTPLPTIIRKKIPTISRSFRAKQAKRRGVLYMLGTVAVVAVLIVTQFVGRGDDPTPTPFVGVTNEIPTEVVAVVEEPTVTPSMTAAPLTDAAIPPTSTVIPPTKIPASPTSTRTPTKMPTKTPSETPTPTSSPTTELWVIVNVGSGNLRSGPGTVYTVAAKLDEGTKLYALERTTDSKWLRVEVVGTGVQGWIATTIVEINFVVGTLRLAQEIPPTPRPPTATPIPIIEAETKWFAISVRGVTSRTKVIKGRYRDTQAEGIYLIVPMRWRNTALIEQSLSVYKPRTCIVGAGGFYGDNCKLWDISGTGGYYSSNPRGISYDDMFPNLKAGEVYDGWMVFDIPEDFGTPVLRIYYDTVYGARRNEIAAEVPLP